ncbi:hypothetical protein B0H17DRAFT_1209637 [Mycena rosella]|uniref:Uncharacterized protein n=1 Tax=Mycena rosella TaxID=1033263 RepID=A0AAD7CTS3_MYCRO|nr:hypothetical protein B0H17DRAFT_1212976 [Mycena rosella]KAJ7669676.1 hypothetical protein B0H17DRAFT_1209637 [Mycena rosella]
MPGRPDWALQPLPGLHRVPRTPAPTRCAQQAFPTPPPSSPVRGDARARAPALIPVDPRLPALIPVGSRLLPIDLTSNVGERLPKKRKISAILDVSDIIDVSDSEDETPCKKNRFLGVVDLTN